MAEDIARCRWDPKTPFAASWVRVCALMTGAERSLRGLRKGIVWLCQARWVLSPLGGRVTRGGWLLGVSFSWVIAP